MSTTFAKKETVERKWYVIDAAGKPLGRVAVQAATLLRGKHKPTFTPNVDCGDFVINLKEVKYATLMAEKPEFAMELAVKGMLPKNSIGRSSMTRLKVYAGAEHKNAAQKPEPWTAI